MIKKLLKILIIFLILIIIILIFKSKSKMSFEDILFLKLFQNSTINSNVNSNNNTQNDYYEFNVNGKTKQIKSIDLYSTINTNNLIKEKIAPGTSGEFSIGLKANKKSKYRIYFVSKNEKPINLKFEAYQKNNLICEADTLEKLSNDLTGIVQQNELKVVNIKWYWNYESEGMQDTKDSKIEKYEFSIYVEGEESK